MRKDTFGLILWLAFCLIMLAGQCSGRPGTRAGWPPAGSDAWGPPPGPLPATNCLGENAHLFFFGGYNM